MPTFGQAQTALEAEPEERWYQVELLIFSRRATGGNGEPITEQWRSDISLSYPDNWVMLQTPEQYDAELQLVAEKQQQALNMDRFFDFTEEATSQGVSDFEAPESAESSNKQDEALSPAIEALSPDFSEAESDLATEAETFPTLELRPYLFLPEEELALLEQANSLQRDKRFTLLFHQAWRQAPKSLSKTPALIISGGHQYGDHTELEGSIKLSIARYLHLHTNLWLSEFEPNYGQGKAHSEHSLTEHDWPDLPKAPSAEDDNDKFVLSNLEQGWQGSLTLNALSGGDEYNAILAKPYLTRNIIKMTQSRRMRSNEVHYIDHPRMGVIIKLTPFERPSEILEGATITEE